MLEVILIFAILAIICIHPLQHRISYDYESGETRWGFFEWSAGIEGYLHRDLDLTLSLSFQYFTFQLSLWWITFYIGWSMYGTHADCDRDQECDKCDGCC